MTGVLDYGIGNIGSILNMIKKVGAQGAAVRTAEELSRCDRLILPGVGRFDAGMALLCQSGMRRALDRAVAQGVPLLGICLGMQLLFEKSYEYGCWEGLGYLPGSVQPLADVLPKGLKVPHIGWNALHILDEKEPLLRYTPQGAYVYYVHSYYAADCAACVKAQSEYGVPVPGVVRRGNVCGTQFHPEKSGQVGLNILRAFASDSQEGAI